MVDSKVGGGRRAGRLCRHASRKLPMRFSGRSTLHHAGAGPQAGQGDREALQVEAE